MNDMHSTMFNAYNNQGNTTRFDITELESLFYDLCSILKSDRSKHSADIIASKATIYPRLDRMKEILSAYKEPTKWCSECPLWKHSEDLRVARETIDRLVYYTKDNTHYSPALTHSEAENLRDIMRSVLNEGDSNG